MKNTENQRLEDHYASKENWLKWGPYLSERQWGTVREDYSADGNAWDYFPHDHARSRTYRWGEDGLAGISDEWQRLCFAVALWNGKDAILKERLFGLTGPEGNCGEDVKELYYYLDNTPTHSFMRYLYKYPQNAFPYEQLVKENRGRAKSEGEYEILDTGVFEEGRYFDVEVQYAKADSEDILIQIVVANRGSEDASLHILPTLWFRNEWKPGRIQEKPNIFERKDLGEYEVVKLTHPKMGAYQFYFEKADTCLFTENETNRERIHGTENESPYVKDFFHEVIVDGKTEPVDAKKSGTKFSPVYVRLIGAGKKRGHSLAAKQKSPKKGSTCQRV